MNPNGYETATGCVHDTGSRRGRLSGDAASPPDHFLAAIVDSSNDAIISETLDGIITSWNPAAARLFGYTAGEAIDQHISLIIPVEHLLELPMIMERLRQGQRIDHFETVRVRKDGTRCHISLSISPIHDDTGHIIGAASIGRDISEQRRGDRERRDLEERVQEAARQPEAALAETNAILETINRIGRLLVAELDVERLIQAVTDAATTLTGAQFGAFFYNALDEQGEHYTLYAISGVPREAFSQFPLPRNTAMFGPTFRGEGTLRIPDVRCDPRFAQNAPYHGLPQGHLPVVSYLAVPVIGRAGTVLGGLFFGHHEPGVFDERSERLAEGLAGQAAVAVENAHLFQQVQRELKARTESEERFRTAFDSAASGMALIDLDGRFLQVNAALCELTGYSEAELLARTIQGITYPDDFAADLGQMQRLVTGEIGSYQIAERYLHKSGQVVWGHLSAAVVRDALGSPLHVIGQVEDITARKRAELALEWERFLLHALMANLPDAVYFKDAQHRFIRVNPVAAALYGLDDPDAAVGLTDFDVYPEEQARQFWYDERPILEAGTPLVNRLEQQADAGDAWRWTLATKVPIVDPGGQVSGLVGISRDISELVLAEAALRQSEERFRTAFDYAAIGMDLVALDGRYLQVNAALCALTGYTETELLTRTFQDITHPDDLAADLAHLDRILAGEIAAFQMEKRYIRKDGQVVWVRLSTTIVHDEQGAPLHFIGQVEDITARKAAEEDLRSALVDAQAANRAKGVFLDLMSHELRTPLQAVLGYSEFLLIAPQDSLSDQQREDIGTIHQAGGRMIALVNQLLELSRMDASHLDLAVEPVDLEQVIEAVRQDITPLAAAKELTMEITLPPSLPRVTGDAERVRQILLNLAGNAVKFTQQGGVSLAVDTTTAGGVVIAVRDTGIGITADAMPHVFEAFYQVDSSLTRRHEGSGLGLAIAGKLAEQMGGSIRVSSEPGVGSTFRLHLPGTLS